MTVSAWQHQFLGPWDRLFYRIDRGGFEVKGALSFSGPPCPGRKPAHVPAFFGRPNSPKLLVPIPGTRPSLRPLKVERPQDRGGGGGRMPPLVFFFFAAPRPEVPRTPQGPEAQPPTTPPGPPSPPPAGPRAGKSSKMARPKSPGPRPPTEKGAPPHPCPNPRPSPPPGPQRFPADGFIFPPKKMP